MSNARTKASVKYNAANVRQVKFNFNVKTDADILAHLDTIENKQGYIKALIRQDITQKGE